MNSISNKSKRRTYKATIICLSISTAFFIHQQEKQFILERELDFVKQQSISFSSEATAVIQSQNVKNYYHLQDDRTVQLLEAIKTANVIGTQEATRKIVEPLQTIASNQTFSISGGYRYGNGIIGHLLDLANETNSILSQTPIYLEETKMLPWIPRNVEEMKTSIQKGSLMSRIVTHGVTLVEGIGYVHVFNTHLDYGVPSIQRRQVEQLLVTIDAWNDLISLPTIITGDFNMTAEEEPMQELIFALHTRGIERVPFQESTYQGKRTDENWEIPPKEVDAIFLSKELQIVSYQTIDSEQSDHKILEVTIKKIRN